MDKNRTFVYGFFPYNETSILLMSRPASQLKRFYPFIVLLAIGGVMAYFLMGREWSQMKWEIPGTPKEYPLTQLLRPWFIWAGCFMPCLAALIYAFSSIMDKYISRLFLSSFFLCTTILCTIFIIGDFAENASDFTNFENPLLGICRFYAMQAPMILNLVLPYTLLLGVLWSLAKLSSSSEITGMLQSGRSLLRITSPIMIGSCFIAVYFGIFGFHWAPNATLYRKLLFSTLDQTQKVSVDPDAQTVRYRNDADGRIWSIRIPPGIDTPGAPLQDVHIEFFDAPGEIKSELFAESAQWDPNTRTWSFHNAIKRTHSPGTALTDIPVFDPALTPVILADYEETPWQLISASIRPDTQGTPEIVNQLSNPALSKELNYRLRTEFHVRIARMFSCIILAFIAIPSSITFQRRSVMAGIGIAIFLAAAMLFLYEFFPALASEGYLSPWFGAWLPNIIYISIAVYLYNSRLAMRSPIEWLNMRKLEKNISTRRLKPTSDTAS